jgi:hypothetical protein
MAAFRANEPPTVCFEGGDDFAHLHSGEYADEQDQVSSTGCGKPPNASAVQRRRPPRRA